MGTGLLKARWPEIDKEILIDPVEGNQALFDWFLENTPAKSVMGHAMVSGCHAYNVITLRKPLPAEHPVWYTLPRNEAPVGTVGIFVNKGLNLYLAFKYGELTETATYEGGIIGMVRDDDIPVLKEVGLLVWDATYNTKKIITCRYEEA